MIIKMLVLGKICFFFKFGIKREKVNFKSKNLANTAPTKRMNEINFVELTFYSCSYYRGVLTACNAAPPAKPLRQTYTP